MNRNRRFVIMLLVVVFLAPAIVEAGWEYVASMPNSRYGHDATLGVDGKIYVMGGLVFDYKIPDKYNNGRYSNLVYDPVKDVWEVLEPVPGWVRVNKNLVMFLDPKPKKWVWIEILPDKKNYYRQWDNMKKAHVVKEIIIPAERIRSTDLRRQGDGVAIVTGKDGLIYWIGGNGKYPGSYGESLVLPYDPENEKWPASKHVRKEYVLQREKGASIDASDKNAPRMYRTLTEYKTKMPAMNERRIDHEAVSTPEGKIYVMGGRNWERFEDDFGNVTRGKMVVLDTVECYDPATNKWEYCAPMKGKRFCFAAVVGADGLIYTFGGIGGYKSGSEWDTYDIVEVYNPERDTWTSLNSMQEARGFHAGVLGSDGRIYILGGTSSCKSPPLRDVLIYDTVHDSWKKGPDMKALRSTLSSVATHDGKIYAIGGTDVGAYAEEEKKNRFLQPENQAYAGQVLESVEVLNITRLLMSA